MSDEAGRELESKQLKGAGAYYTPKDLLPIDPQTETGGFLKKIYDWLIRKDTQNPPYSTGKK